MKLTLHQINTTVGDFSGNIDKIINGANEAISRGSSLAVFPELSLTGYPPLDLLENRTFIKASEDALDRLLERSINMKIAIIFGTVMPRRSSGDGKQIHNSALLIMNGRILETHNKVLLPSYDVFDEQRYFEPGAYLTDTEIDGHQMAISVCEDAWNDKTYWTNRLYQRDPVEELLSVKSMPLINIAASPYSRGKNSLRSEMLQNIARRFEVPVLYVNQVGGNDSLVFDGRSLAVGPGGSIIAQAAEFNEDMLLLDLSAENRPIKIDVTEDMESLLNAIVTGIRDYAYKCGFKSAVLGLSGGIDSSLTAVLAAHALGPENIHGILMPSPFTSSESTEDAEELASTLGINTKNIPITGIYRQYLADLSDGLEGLPGDVTEENIQARIRGNILMALSNRFGCLVLSTGNKSELATGYCTLYGDMSGGLAVISDLYKGEVFELSRYINRESHVIPERVLTKAPSAELKPDQKDEDSLPPYVILDAVLKAYIEDHKTLPEIVKMGYSLELVASILNMVEGNEYKRQQAAPGIKVSWKAFGLGRRYPIAKADLF